MSKIIKARVLSGRFTGEIVRISNISQDEMGRQNAACILSTGVRANIRVSELEVIPVEVEAPSAVRRAQTASMPFISGSSSSRTLTHTKNMARKKTEVKTPIISKKTTLAQCASCGIEYNLEERKGQPGKITDCENCAIETENLAEGEMIFSHKTGATIEIKKDGELRHEAETFDPKNKT